MWLTVVCGCRLYNLWLTVVGALIGGCSPFSLVFGADTIFSEEWSNSLRNQESTIQSTLPIVRESAADVSMTLGSGLCGENVTKRSEILESKISRHGSRAEFMKKVLFAQTTHDCYIYLYNGELSWDHVDDNQTTFFVENIFLEAFCLRPS